MAVTHAPAGFTGTVDQIDEARRFAVSGGGRFRVNSSTDWVPSATGATRTVSITAGMASACGVIDITTAADTLTFAANGGGSDRFDAVVATFDWSNGTIAFRVIQGTTVVPVIVRTGTTVDTAKINWLPGTRYDAVIAVIRARPGVTVLAPADLYDCRPYGSWRQLTVPTAAQGGVIDMDYGGRIVAADTGVVWEWNGTTFGYRRPTVAIFGADTITASGFTTPGTTGVGLQNVGPALAHPPGTVRVRIHGEWMSSVNAAGYLAIGYATNSSGTGVVQLSGSRIRIHNQAVPNVPLPFSVDGYFDSDGVAKYFYLLGDTDVSGAGYQIVQSSLAAWLL